MESSTSVICDRIWKRPTDTTAPFPNVWRRFQTVNENGRTFELRIEDLTSDQYEEVWDMYKKHYYKNGEQLARLSNIIADEESMTSQRKIFDFVVNQNLSVVAVLDNENLESDIVGCLLLDVASKEDPPLPKMPGSANLKIDDLLTFVRGEVDEFTKLNIDCVLRHFGLVVKTEYRRLKIGIELFKTMECIGKMFHIPAASVMLSGAASQRFSTELGCTLFNEVRLVDYWDENGHYIFPVVDPNLVIQYGYIQFS